MPAGLVAGYLADRTSNVLVLFACMLLQAVAVAIIAVGDSLPMALLFAVLWGVGFGGRVPLLTAIIGEFFGRKHFGTILGVNMIPSNIAMIFAPLFAGYMFDETPELLGSVRCVRGTGVRGGVFDIAGAGAWAAGCIRVIALTNS